MFISLRKGNCKRYDKRGRNLHQLPGEVDTVGRRCAFSGFGSLLPSGDERRPDFVVEHIHEYTEVPPTCTS